MRKKSVRKLASNVVYQCKPIAWENEKQKLSYLSSATSYSCLNTNPALLTRTFSIKLSKQTNQNKQKLGTDTTQLLHKYHYYSFKIFPRFWLVKTTRIIHHNQLLFTKFGKNLRHWINDVKSAARRKLSNRWRQNDVESVAGYRLLNRWPRKPEDKVELYLVSGKTKSEMAKLL